MKPEMTIQQRSQAALHFLDEADREFALGDIRQASEKLWGAASDAIIAVALERGWRYHSHRDIKNAMQRLIAEQDDDILQSGFTIAEKFHVNFYHDLMEDHELDRDRPAAHRFVHLTLSLLQTD